MSRKPSPFPAPSLAPAQPSVAPQLATPPPAPESATAGSEKAETATTGVTTAGTSSAETTGKDSDRVFLVQDPHDIDWLIEACGALIDWLEATRRSPDSLHQYPLEESAQAIERFSSERSQLKLQQEALKHSGPSQSDTQRRLTHSWHRKDTLALTAMTTSVEACMHKTARLPPSAQAIIGAIFKINTPDGLQEAMSWVSAHIAIVKLSRSHYQAATSTQAEWKSGYLNDSEALAQRYAAKHLSQARAKARLKPESFQIQSP